MVRAMKTTMLFVTFAAVDNAVVVRTCLNLAGAGGSTST
jgi:hypothetical protein